MWKNNKLPEFGCLKGVKVLHATLSTAGPVAAQMLADHGADVIWLENAKGYDIVRYANSFAAEAERRNQRNLALDIPSPEGRKIFLELIKDADVFLETSKGGQYAKWGLTDEAMWEVNPKLVIAHISGFGQTGLPEYVSRPSYDAIAQAFGGYTWLNMNPQTAPYSVGPYAADFFTAVFTAMSISMALYKVAVTGVGESIDVAQYELMMRVQQHGSDMIMGNDAVVEKAGNPAVTAGWGCLPCKDGIYIQCCLIGGGIVKKTCEFLGIEYGTDLIPSGAALIRFDSNPEGAKLYQDTLLKYLASKTGAEAEKEMQAAGLPVNKLNTLKDLAEDPHVQAREMFVEYKNNKGADVKCVGPVPKFVNTPGKVWGCSPYPGKDNEEILGELGYGKEDIAALYEKKVVTKDTEMKTVFAGPKK